MILWLMKWNCWKQTPTMHMFVFLMVESLQSTCHLAPYSLPDSPQEDSAIVTPSLPSPFDRDDSYICDFEGFESPTSPMEGLTPDHVPGHNGYSPPSPASSPVPQLHCSTRAIRPVDRLQLSF